MTLGTFGHSIHRFRCERFGKCFRSTSGRLPPQISEDSKAFDSRRKLQAACEPFEDAGFPSSEIDPPDHAEPVYAPRMEPRLMLFSGVFDRDIWMALRSHLLVKHLTLLTRIAVRLGSCRCRCQEPSSGIDESLMRTYVPIVCLATFGALFHSGRASTIVLPDLPPGSQYQILFVTAATTEATSSDINYYNGFVSTQAAPINAWLPAGTSWTAVASTVEASAVDNVTRAYVPVYDTLGHKLAATSYSRPSPARYSAMHNSTNTVSFHQRTNTTRGSGRVAT